MMNKYQFDRYIKSEVESIDFDGGLEAWEQFDAGRTQEPKPAVGYFRKLWKPIAVAASVSVFCGLLLHQSLINETTSLTDSTFVNVEQGDSKTSLDITEDGDDSEQAIHLTTITQKVNESEITQKVSEDVKQVGVTESTDTYVNAKQANSDNLLASSKAVDTHTVAQTTSTIAPPHYLTLPTKSKRLTQRSQTSYQVADLSSNERHGSTDTNLKSNIPSTITAVPLYKERINAALWLPSIPSDALATNIPAMRDFSLDLDDSLIDTKRHKLKFFGELSIGNRAAGKQAIVGVAIHNDSWSIETGLGLNQKGNQGRKHIDVVDSNIEDYKEVHRYTFAQRLNAIIPVRIRKRLGKRHAILVGVQGSYNLTNQVDIMSTIPVRGNSLSGNVGGGFGASEINLYDINYKYSNINNAINSYALVSANRLNLDLTAGYEFNFDRVALGVTVRKPVFSTWKVSRELSSPTSFKITEQSNVNISLKYYLG